MAVVLADFCHTFPDEVRLMWNSRLGIPKILFFGLRYYLIAHRILCLVYALPPDMSPSECDAAFFRVGISTCALVTGSDAILYYRVYAFSGKGMRMMGLLVFQFIAMHGAAFYMLWRFLGSVIFVDLPIQNIGCMPVKSSNIFVCGSYILVLASLTIIMFIMIYTAIRDHREVNSGLMRVFCRDGVFFYICLSTLASANIITNITAPEGLKLLLVQTEADAHVILATRMLLHLREWGEREVAVKRDMEMFGDWTTGTISGRFARQAFTYSVGLVEVVSVEGEGEAAGESEVSRTLPSTQTVV